jgi:glutaminyl-tRNA synthetase
VNNAPNAAAVTDAVDSPAAPTRTHFIRDIIDADLASGKHVGVVTRFPPEPNGYLHIGHAKSISVNFGLAKLYGGRCHLRFDDTNPATEDVEYVESIQNDVKWLGFDWGEHLYFASDYFEQMYDYAMHLIKTGKAYVCALSKDAFKDYRGTIYAPGKPSPYRDRPISESVTLFEEMRAGKHPEGSLVLRAKIDMASPNMIMRDPPLYRIRFAAHHRTGTTWPIYPMYDYAHCLEDATEHITHSICTLEFETNRELYDWVLDNVPAPCHPQQLEFARLTVAYTMTSKRKLLQLVNEGIVSGWDDPRMPTIAGLRRRGVTAAAIRAFCDMTGVTKSNSVVDIEKFDYCVREDLNHRSPRLMAVLRPLKVTITNLPEGHAEVLDASLWPHDVPREGSRPLSFSRTLFIDREDFQENPPPKWHRLAPGAEVRLRYGYVIRCDEVIHDLATGEPVELRCTYDAASRGDDASARKVKGIIHWVNAADALRVEVRLYDLLFTAERPDGDPDRDFRDNLNPASLITLTDALIEPYAAAAAASGDSHFQFERTGYFFIDPIDSRPDALVFNRVVGLRDSWAKMTAADAPDAAPARAPKAAPAPSAPTAPKARTPEALALQTAHSINDEAADTLAADPALYAFFSATLLLFNQPATVANWVTNDLRREAKGSDLSALSITPAALARLLTLADTNRVTLAAAREVFTHLASHGGDPDALIASLGLESISDDAAITSLIDATLSALATEVARYRSGEKQLQGFIMGHAMKAAKGKADPKTLRALLLSRLDQP